MGHAPWHCHAQAQELAANVQPLGGPKLPTPATCLGFCDRHALLAPSTQLAPRGGRHQAVLGRAALHEVADGIVLIDALVLLPSGVRNRC